MRELVKEKRELLVWHTRTERPHYVPSADTKGYNVEMQQPEKPLEPELKSLGFVNIRPGLERGPPGRH